MRVSEQSGHRGAVRVLVLVALFVAGCYRTVGPPDLTEDVWAGPDGDRQLAFEFTASHIGVHASIHVLRDGRKISEMRADVVEIEAPVLDVRWGGGRTFRGSVDFEGRRIDGEITGVGGGPRELHLTRIDPATLPGFPARPGEAAGAAYEWTLPPPANDGWATASPEEVGLDRGALEQIVSAIIAGDAGEIHSLLIVRDGKLVLEEYFYGYTRDDLHGVESCSYGVASLLIGIAVDQGRIRGVDVPVLEFFPDLRAAAAPGWERVTLEHVLTMTTGKRDRQRFPIRRSEGGEALFRGVLNGKLTDDPGSLWYHSDRNANLLSGVLRQATGAHADEFAARFLFEPLGIESFEWKRAPEGEYPRMHAGLRLRPRDMAKLGLLMLEDGRWLDRQVVSSDWIRASSSEQLDFLIAGDEQYGYLWWLPPVPDSVGGGRVITAMGWGSQYIYAAPGLDTVFVLTGGNHFNGNSFLPQRVLLGYLPAAFRQ